MKSLWHSNFQYIGACMHAFAVIRMHNMKYSTWDLSQSLTVCPAQTFTNICFKIKNCIILLILTNSQYHPKSSVLIYLLIMTIRYNLIPVQNVKLCRSMQHQILLHYTSINLYLSHQCCNCQISLCPW